MVLSTLTASENGKFCLIVCFDEKCSMEVSSAQLLKLNSITDMRMKRFMSRKIRHQRQRKGFQR